MAYNDDFYKAYEAYLKEPVVRDAHDWVFSLFRWNYEGEQRRGVTYKYDDIVDLGCGQFNEFKRYYDPIYYVGIDENAVSNQRNNDCLIHGNYRDRKVLASAIDQEHSAFVSLFSSEITAHYTENYRLYNWIFNTFPNIRAGLVSGFYYTHKKHKNPIKETGGIVSYQTLEDIEDRRIKRRGFTEKRIVLPVPSKMFGNKVVEVWKIFERS